MMGGRPSPECIDLTEDDDDDVNDHHSPLNHSNVELHLRGQSSHSSIHGETPENRPVSPVRDNPETTMPILSPIISIQSQPLKFCESQQHTPEHSPEQMIIGDVEDPDEDGGVFSLPDSDQDEHQSNGRSSSPPPPTLKIEGCLSLSKENNDHSTVTFTSQVGELLPPLTPLAFNVSPPSSRRKSKIEISSHQRSILERYFKQNSSLNAISILELMTKTDLDKKFIQSWFLSQRRKMAKHNTLKNTVQHQKQRKGSLVTESENSSSSRMTAGQCTPGPSRNVSAPYIPSQSDISKRMESVAHFRDQEIMDKINENTARVKTLVQLFMSSKMEMKPTLLTETKRLEEMGTKSSPFNDSQTQVLQEWQTLYFTRLRKNRSTTQSTLDKLSLVQKIVGVWLPIMVYGKLLGLSLENGIQDYTFNSRNRSVSSGSSDYTIPYLIRYRTRIS